MNGDHIKESKRYMLGLSIEQKIKSVQNDLWIECPHSTLAIRMISNMVMHVDLRRGGEWKDEHS
jgi:hypothetical protein